LQEDNYKFAAPSSARAHEVPIFTLHQQQPNFELIPLQQLQREYRDSQKLFVVPKPTETNVSTKRKKKRTKENQKSNKRQRTAKPNWATKSAPKISSASFNNVQNEVLKETLAEIEKSKEFGLEFENQILEITSALDLETTQKILAENNNFENIYNRLY
jgi:hypothetical protein